MKPWAKLQLIIWAWPRKPTSDWKEMKKTAEKKHMKEILKLLFSCICAGICICTSKKMPRCRHWCQPCIHSTHHCSMHQPKGLAKALSNHRHPSCTPTPDPRLDIPLPAAQPFQWAPEVTPTFSTEAAAAPSLSAPLGHKALRLCATATCLHSASQETTWSTLQSTVKQPGHRVPLHCIQSTCKEGNNKKTNQQQNKQERNLTTVHTHIPYFSLSSCVTKGQFMELADPSTLLIASLKFPSSLSFLRKILPDQLTLLRQLPLL